MGNGLSLLSVFGFTLTLFVITKPHLCLTDTSKDCNSSLNLQSPQLTADTQFSASSFLHNYYLGQGKYTDLKPSYARLNGQHAWCVRQRRRSSSAWLMVDLEQAVNITSIATQGYVGVNDYYVKSFSILYSLNGIQWTRVMDGNKTKVFDANKDGVGTVRSALPTTITARFVKIVPVSFSIMVCLRIELYGCSNGTLQKMVTLSPIMTSTSSPTTALPPSQTPLMMTTASSAMMTSTLSVISSSTSSVISPSTSLLVSSQQTTSIGISHDSSVVATTMLPSTATSSSISFTIKPTLAHQTSKETVSTTTAPMAGTSTAQFDTHIGFTSANSGLRVDHGFPVSVVVGSSLGAGVVFLVLVLLLVVRLRKQRMRRSLSDQAELLVIETPIDDATFQLNGDKPQCTCHTQLITSSAKSSEDIGKV